MPSSETRQVSSSPSDSRADLLQLDLVETSAHREQVTTSPAAESETDVEENEEDEAAPSATAAASTGADDDVRQVSQAEAAAYAQECGLLFFEASAKTGANVGEVFTEIGKSYHRAESCSTTHQV